MRGGTYDDADEYGSAWGLSPHARGNPLKLPHATGSSGSIPACAGEPLRGPCSGCTLGVYPRMRGGTLTPAVMGAPFGGLSPHARGNPKGAWVKVGFMGSIPACAGEPRRQPHLCSSCGVYPRMRGGTSGHRVDAKLRTGLSPHARGNPLKRSPHVSTQGSIPACAGEPVRHFDFFRIHWVYPRMRGGTAATLAIAIAMSGLSPHARGNRGVREMKTPHPGSIPACAGEPVLGTWTVLPSWVYPRMRGGTLDGAGLLMCVEGLSPHARGNPIQVR